MGVSTVLYSAMADPDLQIKGLGGGGGAGTKKVFSALRASFWSNNKRVGGGGAAPPAPPMHPSLQREGVCMYC